MLAKPNISFKKAKLLSKEMETPFLVLSKKKIEENYTRLSLALENKVSLFYAVKANPISEVIEIIKNIGGGFEVSSADELRLVMNFNVPLNKIFYSTPVKKRSEISYFYKEGINLFVFDNDAEIEKIAQCAPKSQVMLRIQTKNKNSLIDLSLKFGAEPKDALYLLEKARNMGLYPRGICFHVGSQCLSPESYKEAIKLCHSIFEAAAEKGIHLDLLNIGGGFPIGYRKKVPDITTFCKTINEALKYYFYGRFDVDVVAEPGRFICADAFTLVTRVIGKSIRNNKIWYYIDDGLYGSFSGRIYDKGDYLILTEKDGYKVPSVLAGPTCDSFDVIYEDYELPDLKIDDLILVPGMGAYTIVSASNFNGFKRAKVVVID